MLLFARDRECRAKLLECGGVGVLVTALRTHTASSVVQETGCRTLWGALPRLQPRPAIPRAACGGRRHQACVLGGAALACKHG